MPIYFKGVVSAANFCTSLRRVELVLVAMKLEGEEGESFNVARGKWFLLKYGPSESNSRVSAACW